MNTASGSGGAIYLNQSMMAALFRATLSDNRAESGNGGAIYATAQTRLVVDESKFLRNYAKHSGGGVCVTESLLSTAHTQFERNVADGRGGAIYDQQESTVLISQCDFLYNKAPYSDGGAVHLDRSEAVITGSDFTGNAAKGNGGAIDEA
jgi:predicted outer membrane repeat protein